MGEDKPMSGGAVPETSADQDRENARRWFKGDGTTAHAPSRDDAPPDTSSHDKKKDKEKEFEGFAREES